MVEILRELAGGLDVRCIGIKKMDHAPDVSVETLAKYSISFFNDNYLVLKADTKQRSIRGPVGIE